MAARRGRIPPQEPPCGRLGQNEDYGVVDMCGEPSGHDRAGEMTPHKGRYHGMVWVNPGATNPHASEAERRRQRIIDPGDIMGAAHRGELEPTRAPTPPKHSPAIGYGTAKPARPRRKAS